jgi:class 3 adenylate cyclase
MTPVTEQRRRAAIMFTDIVGYPDALGARRETELALELTTLHFRRKWSL